ncbi:hypothetical protein TSAR_005392 [Trichomalopsis sarcophagae]|uniref:Uncharacterized protein n=1 Tax=Trichomalopsis sarcophagae TaxID=543379 RepID=A0A232ETQ9_9HYME|nr:hypothetical protein TSAR_005392 [Trichomalopsis sarcophagae]
MKLLKVQRKKKGTNIVYKVFQHLYEYLIIMYIFKETKNIYAIQMK